MRYLLKKHFLIFIQNFPPSPNVCEVSRYRAATDNLQGIFFH